MKLQNWMAEVEARLKAATRGPWDPQYIYWLIRCELKNPRIDFDPSERGTYLTDKSCRLGLDDHKLIAHSPTDLAKALKIIAVQAEALSKMQHAIANAQEWDLADPSDTDLDSDAQVGNWIEAALDVNREAQNTVAKLCEGEPK